MDQELIELGAKSLKKAALNEQAKEYLLNSPALFQALKKAADRYIGGETMDETIEKVVLENARGYKCSMEFMGENTLTEKEANKATDEFVKMAEEIAFQKLYSTISLDLSHIGLAISKELAQANIIRILDAAKAHGTEVIISAEGVNRTDDVLETYLPVVKDYSNVSITMQAYLHRSKDDFQELIRQQGRIRLVKGAFDTPTGVSLPRGRELDETYLHYLDALLSEGHLCSIATHDNSIQQEALKLISKYQPSKDIYEFESLYGIQAEQLAVLKEQGHPAKVYFVYGKEWYLYLCNRIAEYPLNIFHAINDIVG
ncbi:proline dehydrogenase family protein [Fulvivirga sp. 29W222]|uniref:Proline dehydrogenase family protein n=1 Tax=Fulvivirga marina TaxID=2494733 RepID=A0A937KCA6_9BACT|nr:proline dehydrogenase family protein [Fulvivirga marina]MBL6447961.1 proline dehydrogenase family protein [Fulvivirga marina]